MKHPKYLFLALILIVNLFIVYPTNATDRTFELNNYSGIEIAFEETSEVVNLYLSGENTINSTADYGLMLKSAQLNLRAKDDKIASLTINIISSASDASGVKARHFSVGRNVDLTINVSS